MKKHIICLVVMLTVALILPLLAVYVFQGDSGMGIAFLLFFAVDPMTAAALGYGAGRNLRKLWYVPLIYPIVFMAGFSLAVMEIVWDLWVYAGIYLALGLLAAGLGFLLKKK